MLVGEWVSVVVYFLSYIVWANDFRERAISICGHGSLVLPNRCVSF